MYKKSIIEHKNEITPIVHAQLAHVHSNKWGINVKILNDIISGSGTVKEMKT